MSERLHLPTVVVTAVALLIAGALLFGPALIRERTPVASTAAPTPFFGPAPVEVPPGGTLCATSIVLGPRTEVAELVLGAPGQTTDGLEVWASGPGYRSVAVPLEGGTAPGGAATARIDPPDRQLLGSLCVVNTRDTPATFVATNEFRTQTRLQTTLDGEPVPADLALTFYEDRQVTLLGYVPELLDHMTIFRGFLGVTWLMWLVLVAVVAGVPLTVLWVLGRAVAEDRA